MSCINKNSEEFKNLLKETGYSKTVLAAKIDAFQKKKGIDSFPTAKDLLIKETETTFKNIVGFPIDDRDKEKVDKKEILSKGFSFLKDKKGNNMPHSYVEEFTSTLTNLFFSIREDESISNKNVFKEIEQELQDKYEFHKSITKKEHLTPEVLEEAPATIKENQLLADYFKHIIDNKEIYFDRVVDKIKKMGFTMSSNSTKLDETSLNSSNSASS